jgi:CHAD domain-containing protein
VARPREVPGFDCEETFAAAAARVVRVRATEVFQRSRGVLDVEQIENVHDMRVATRRLRSALEVFEPCFPRKRFRRALREVKDLADALGERRDRDVQIEQLTRLSAVVVGPDREAMDDLIESLRTEQLLANGRLAGAVEDERLRKLRCRLNGLAKAAKEQ